jgi:uncharacterized membrane protein
VRGEAGRLGVREVEAARVYHINSNLEIKTQACLSAHIGPHTNSFVILTGAMVIYHCPGVVRVNIN